MLVLITNWRGLLSGFVKWAEKGNAGGECTIKASKRLLGTDVRCVVGDKVRGRGGGEGRDLFAFWGCAGYESYTVNIPLHGTQIPSRASKLTCVCLPLTMRILGFFTFYSI